MEESRIQHAVLITKHLRPERGGALRRDDARNLLRRTIEYHVNEGRLVIYAWNCLPSRTSLVIALPTPKPLADTVGDLYGYFTRRFNARYAKEGALFRTKFLKRVLTGADEIRAAIERVNRAPDENHLAQRPGSEAWSSAVVGGAGSAIRAGSALADRGSDGITSRFEPKPHSDAQDSPLLSA